MMNLRARAQLFLKGMSMGAADVVPGVSGGTIAFISGIYEELLGSIKSIGPDTWRALRQQGVLAAWRQINGDFLLTLVAGIITSIALLVRPITWALQAHPVLIWGFFFGLIATSVWLCGKLVKRWGAAPLLGLLLGAAIALFIGLAEPGTATESLAFYFMAGAIAICAMILPGISGSFILLLLGAYVPVMTAVKGFDLPVIIVFGTGCLFGLLAFSRVLNWMFARHHDLTVATLTGFLLGSLYIVWPWKQVLSTRIVHPGKPDEHLEPFITRSIWPRDYAALTDIDMTLGITTKDPQILGAVLLALVGASLLLVLERFAPPRA
jgi:putative membrane protein